MESRGPSEGRYAGRPEIREENSILGPGFEGLTGGMVRDSFSLICFGAVRCRGVSSPEVG